MKHTISREEKSQRRSALMQEVWSRPGFKEILLSRMQEGKEKVRARCQDQNDAQARLERMLRDRPSLTALAAERPSGSGAQNVRIETALRAMEAALPHTLSEEERAETLEALREQMEAREVL